MFYMSNWHSLYLILLLFLQMFLLLSAKMTIFYVYRMAILPAGPIIISFNEKFYHNQIIIL